MLCNDCEARTYTPFHFVGNKCGECGGYCTSIIRREVTPSPSLFLPYPPRLLFSPLSPPSPSSSPSLSLSP